MQNLSFLTADIAGSTMSYLDVGAGEPVVLGHSYLWDARMWQPQIAELAKTRRVIVPELWGHGGSGPLPRGTTELQQIASHHLELLDKLELDRFAVVGLSVGGMWAAELALMAPERVSALVLMDTYLGTEPDEMQYRYRAMLASIEQARMVPDLVARMLLPMSFAPATIRTCPDLVDRFLKSLERPDPKMIVETLVPLGHMIFGRRNTLRDLGAIEAPTIVMTGQHDQSRSAAEGRRMAIVIGCDFIEIPEAGHIVSLEAADEVNRQVIAFLDRQGC